MAQVRILYLATGNGVVQLANPGTSDRWRPIGAALEGQAIRTVRASASDPLYAFAGAASGLHVSSDGGSTWEVAYAADVTTMAAASDGSIYAGTAEGHILRGALSPWAVIHTGPGPVERLSLLPDGRLVAVYRQGEVEMFVEQHWMPGPSLAPARSDVVGSRAEPEALFVVGDSGLAGPYGSLALEGAATGALLLLSGKPEVLLVGTDGSIYRSEDGGCTLQALEGPTDARVLVSPPRYEDHAYAGTGDGQLWHSSDRGRTWRKLRDGMAPVHDLAFARVQ
jgi:photosystem II stability/assembly factor-like uncharacterized protein